MIVAYCLITFAYLNIAFPIFKDLKIVQAQRVPGNKYVLTTEFLGTLLDDEVSRLYTTQRLLNVFMNDVVGSVFLSVHQVGMLATVAIMLFFFVKYNSVVQETGAVGYLFVFGAVLIPLTISGFQSNLFGTLVNTSVHFAESGKRKVPRGTIPTFLRRTCLPFLSLSKWNFTSIQLVVF